MHCRKIDLSTYPRREHFEHFLEMQHPFVHVTVRVNITDWFHRLKKAGYPFFLSFQYAVVRAINRVPAFRQRIVEDGIVEYDFCQPSYTFLLSDETYRYCLVHVDQPLEDYIKEAREKESIAHDTHLREEGDVLSLLFTSSVPWIDFSGVQVPYPNPQFSIPTITWGKYCQEKCLCLEDGTVVEKEKITIPVMIGVNHALVDGFHIGQAFSYLKEELCAMFEEPY